MRDPAEVATRLMAGAVLAADGCLVWTRGRDRKGYGQIKVDGATRHAHRIAWELANGPIPDGLLVCHHCDNPSCVRADHLFVGTPKENTRDCINKGRFPGKASGGGRPRSDDPGRSCSFWLSQSQIDSLDEQAAIRGCRRSDVVHEAIDRHLKLFGAVPAEQPLQQGDALE